jgi:hypothetical protein
MLPAASLPAFAAIGPFPDAELIRLGEEYKRLLPSFEAGLAAYNRLSIEANSSAVERFEALIPDRTAQATKASDRVLFGLIKDAWATNGADVAFAEFEPIEEQWRDVVDKIVKLPAKTIEGVRAKLHVAIRENSKLWETSDCDLDWHEQAVRSLMEALCVVVGGEVPREELTGDTPVQS